LAPRPKLGLLLVIVVSVSRARVSLGRHDGPGHSPPRGAAGSSPPELVPTLLASGPCHRGGANGELRHPPVRLVEGALQERPPALVEPPDRPLVEEVGPVGPGGSELSAVSAAHPEGEWEPRDPVVELQGPDAHPGE